MFDFMRNLFADPVGPVKEIYTVDDIPEERQKELIDKIAKGIVERQMTVPAIVTLQSIKPISFLGSQFMIFAKPIVEMILPIASYQEVAIMFEDPDNVELLLRRIEELEDERKKKNKEIETKEEK